MAPEQTLQQKILWEIRYGTYRDAQRLPPENMLAQHLSISRTRLRDCLAELEREGYITRRHGVGTIINRHVVALNMRMDMEIEFSEMIAKSGYTPELAFVRSQSQAAGQNIAQRLNIRPEDEVLCVSKLLLASGKPAIYCEDYLPTALILQHRYAQEALRRPIFDFLLTYCGTEAYMDITEIRPALADQALAELLKVPEGTALLHMDEVDYNIQGEPVLYASQFYVDGIIRHTLMRKKF